MRILDVASYPCLPATHGGAVRAYSLLRGLSARHEVRQFALERARLRPAARRVRELAVTPTFRVVGHESVAYTIAGRCSSPLWRSRSVLGSPALRLARPARLAELAGWADVALVESPWLYRGWRRGRADVPTVLCAHNVERLRLASLAALGRRPAAERRLRYVEELEREAVTGADMVVAVSPDDRLELIGRYGAEPGRVVVVPNGADTARLVPADPGGRDALRRELGLPRGPLAIFAAPRFPTNRAALDWVRRLASRESPFAFVVVGSVSRPGRNGRLAATGLVDDVAPYLQAADVALCPIEYGGGTKIKLLEYLACGLPTVAFAESVHGTELAHEQHLLVAEKSERGLLAAMERLAADPALAARLAAAGRAHVVEHHDWRRGAERLEGALLELLGAAAPPTGLLSAAR